ncbi:MAG TPA: asparagine synthase-related protein, partial [Rhabdochlamydiaceae bacterium]
MQGISGAVDLSFSVSGEDVSSSWIGTVFASCRSSFISERCILGSNPPDKFCFVSSRSGLAIAADAELHNRTQLLSQIFSCDLPSVSSDAALILGAYEKWGEDCPGFLLGEFSFVIWDAANKRLFCCRDHLGTRPFFYWTKGTRIAFSTDLLWLVRLPGVGRELNRGRLAAWAKFAETTGKSQEETFHKGVLSLPAATSLTFEDGKFTKRSYWAPENASVYVPSKDADAFESLRELLFDAVECRMRGKTRVAAFLSGGLDSSA